MQPATESLIHLSPEQREAVEHITDPLLHCSVSLLMGKAGTGKSFTLHAIIDRLRQQRRPFAVCAPTGTAALNVDGCTIHSLFSFKPSDTVTNINHHIPRKLYGVQTLVIDEVSMVRADMLDMIDIALRNTNARFRHLPFGGVQIILCGDPSQLPPVVSSTDSKLIRKNYSSEFFFAAKVWKELQSTEKGIGYYILSHGFRQQTDSTFTELLDLIRSASIDGGHIAHLNNLTNIEEEAQAQGTILTKSNKQKDAINLRALKKLEGQEYSYLAQINGHLQDYQLTFAKLLTVKVGSRVMCIKNIYDESFRELVVSNGDQGEVVECSDKEIFVKLDRTQAVYRFGQIYWEEGFNEYDSVAHATKFKRIASVTQIPLVLASAVTVHKAQGQTLDAVTVDLREGMGDPGMLYTAITRARTLETMSTLGMFNKFSFAYSPQVTNFLRIAEQKNLIGATLFSERFSG